ncbi:MAG: hypothetical protein RIC56_00210 [Pseudomonadales bacterium]
MSHARTRPSAVILDLLRSARSRRQTAAALIEAGALFGFTENTMRVNLSRLMGRGIIDSPSRGLYALSRRTDALNDFVERWRLGEDRVRPWQPGQWLFAHTGAAAESSRWTLSALGFREVRAGLLARPDNLTLDLDALRQLAGGLGLDPGVLLLSGAPEGGTIPSGWLDAWQPRKLNAAYADALSRLADSARRLNDLAPAEARLECFTLGGEMIHRLAKDPLLPAELVDVDARAALWQAMLDYDRQGKEIWALANKHELTHMPRPQLATA